MNARTKAVAAAPSYPMRRNDKDEMVADWTKIDTPVEHNGKRIILPGDPENMDYDTAIETIERVKQSELQVYKVAETVAGLPWDALVASYLAMQQIYGVVLPQTVYSWFGDRPPEFVSVKTGPDAKDVIQVPSGKLELPGMGHPCFLKMMPNGAMIIGEVNKKDRARLVEIANLARQIIREQSIYKGKSIRLMVDEDGSINVENQPEFFDVRYVEETDMIHNRLTELVIKTNILSPIKHTAACRKHKIPLKRGILLEGRFGTGKTLTARVTAKVAMDNGWTFIVLARAQGLASALKVAERYQPAVVFAEDIDRFGDRTKEAVNDLVNLIDGLVPASSAVMTILTTNYIENIDRALLRPGRFDAVISIDAPDAETVERLVRHYGSELLPMDVNTEEVGRLMAGQIPATVAEVVKRAKLAMLGEDREQLTEDDLITSAASMTRHLKLLEDLPEPPSQGDQLYDILKGMVVKSNILPDGQTALNEAVSKIKDTAEQILSEVA